MAKLASDKYVVDINTFPIADPAHYGWHGYSIKMTNIHTCEEAELASSADEPLFLNWSISPEIPMICDAIKQVIEFGGGQIFQPMDDSDFALNVYRADDRYFVRLTSPAFDRHKDLGWPDGVEVDVRDLLMFADQLTEEYSSLEKLL